MAALFGGTLIARWMVRISTVTLELLAAGNAGVPDAYLADPAIDTLLRIMDAGGLQFYNTGQQDGLLRTDQVVVIKANFQWAENLGTNTDRIKGMIWRILQHPDGFKGEILVGDNDQGEREFNECNNSEDSDQSIVDVVNTLSAKGYPVYLMAWDEFGTSTVDEFSDGDMNDGYLSIVSLNGQVIKKMQIKENQQRLNVDGLENGIYLLRFYDSRHALLNQQKLLIQQ